MVKWNVNRISGGSKKTWEEWAQEQQEKHAASQGKTVEATKKTKPGPDTKGRSRGRVVFPAESSAVKDSKDHFPYNSVAQARNAWARVNQYDSAPKWYEGSLDGMKSKVKSEISKAYPSIKLETQKKQAAASKDRTNCIFASTNELVCDNKDHFPVNDEKQAKDAMYRVAQIAEAPKWYEGSLDECRQEVAQAVKAEYPELDLFKKVEAACDCGATDCPNCTAQGRNVDPEGKWEVKREKAEASTEEETVEASTEKIAKDTCHHDCDCKHDCECGCADVPGEEDDVVHGEDGHMASKDSNFVRVAKLTDKDKSWLQKYFAIYYPAEYAAALVSDY